MLAENRASTVAVPAAPTAADTSASRRLHFFLLLCFTSSGASGLIYEVAWVRSLELIFGTTTFAVATVLAAFMGGLACGSYLMGRWATRLKSLHPLQLYGVLELLIAAAAILAPFGFQFLPSLSQWLWNQHHGSFLVFSLLRFAVCFLALLVPTLFMGATLPVLSGFVSQEIGRGASRIGRLYACNTLGAVLGCAAAGLLLFPALGRSATQWVAITLNVLAAAGSFALAASATATKPSPGPNPAPADTGLIEIDFSSLKNQAKSSAHATLLVTLYAASGFVAMLYEVVWCRVLVLTLGASTYAYTLMLTTFLLGLAGGAWLATRCLSRLRHPLLAAGLCQMLIALTSYASVFLVAELPFLYLSAYGALNPSPRGLLHIQFLLSMGLMLLPTLGLGAMFPLTIRGINASGSRATQRVGWAYALNTLGAISGSVAAGFWLVPVFGSQHTLLAGIFLNALLGLVAVWHSKQALPLSRRLALAALTAIFCVSLVQATPRWDPAVLSSGVFRYVGDYLGQTRAQFIERAQRIIGQVLLFQEGLSCTVTVSRTPDNLAMMVNGKPDATTPSGLTNPLDPDAPTGLFDMPTQTLLGQAPLLLAPHRDRVLVIGLGTGVTLGAVLTHPVEQAECVELEDAVVRGSQFFNAHNGQPLSDGRTQLIVNDARNHLLVTDRQYDVIISEPSNPWIPGAANLFTREFFQTSKARLKPGGLFCQWIQLYELQPEHFQTILRTFCAVFPNVHLFRVKHDAILVASPGSQTIDLDLLAQRMTPEVKANLARIQIHSPEDFLAYYWIGGAELRRAIAPGPFNTDDNQLIEFAAPLQMLATYSRDRASANPVKNLFDAKTTAAIGKVRLPPGTEPAQFWARMADSAWQLASPAQALLYARHSLSLGPNPRAAAVLANALASQGARDQARTVLGEATRQFPKTLELSRAAAQFYLAESDWTQARASAQAGLAEGPDDPQLRFCLGRALFHLKDYDASRALLEKIAPAPRDLAQYEELSFYRGAVLRAQGRHADALEFLRRFVARHPTHLDARLQLADSLSQLGQQPAAAAQWQRVAHLYAAAADRLRQDAHQTGQLDAISRALEHACALDPANAELALLCAQARAAQGNLDGAAQLLRDYLAWYPERPPLVGYLSELLAKQQKSTESAALAERYLTLTGKSWLPVGL